MISTFFKKVCSVFAVVFAVLLLICIVAFFVFPLPGHIPVLMYHFIASKEATETNGNVLSEDTFRKQMGYLKLFGFSPISLNEYDAIRSGLRKQQGKNIVLTFDDGSTSVPEKAVPILNEFRFPATLFLISQNLKTGDYGSIRVEEAKQLAKNPLISYGAHSRTHPFLTQIADEDVKKEIIDSKSELENMLEMPILYFAYPYGEFDERSVRAAEEAGYHLAFTTSPKKLKTLKKGIYSVPRVKITESASNLIVFWVKISGIYETYKLWRHSLYQKRWAQTATY